MAFDASKLTGLLGSDALLGTGLGLLSAGWQGALPGYMQGARLDVVNRRDQQAQAEKQALQKAVQGPYAANPWTNPDNPQAGPLTGGILDSLPPQQRQMGGLLAQAGDVSGLMGLLNPKPVSLSPGASLVNPSNGSVVAQAPQAPYTLAPGAIRLGPDNKPVAAAPTAPPTGMVRGPDGSLQYDPNYLAGQKDIRAAGRPQTNVSVGSPKYGPVPAGKMLKLLPDGSALMVDIPGGPTAQAAQQQQQSAATTGDVVTDAYTNARRLIGPATTGVAGQAIGSVLPPSNAAELRRQVNVLRSNASITALNQMRQQSKTGGALGNVTEREEALLADTAGALDPNASPAQFRKSLDTYYHTLLRIVNGPEAGDKLFQQMQQGGGADGQMARPRAHNPQTGETVEFDGQKWVPVQ